MSRKRSDISTNILWQEADKQTVFTARQEGWQANGWMDYIDV